MCFLPLKELNPYGLTSSSSIKWNRRRYSSLVIYFVYLLLEFGWFLDAGLHHTDVKISSCTFCVAAEPSLQRFPDDDLPRDIDAAEAGP